MKKIIFYLVCFIGLVIVAFGVASKGFEPNTHLIETTEQSKQDCANSGHTWQQCNDFWISSGEYKRGIDESPSPEWEEFIRVK